MNERELRRLQKSDLLEMLLDLSKENEQLRRKIADLEEQLKDRDLKIANAGSLAEAVLQLNGVFEAAQKACDQYIYNVQQRCQQMEEEAKARPAEPVQPAEPEQAEPAEQPERTEQPGQVAQPEQTEQPEQPEQTDQTDQESENK